MWTLLLGTALAGYGDAKDGVPSPLERELHAWTDVARVEPSFFRDELPCWGEVPSTQRASHAPLAWHAGLALAARGHSEDMAATGHFAHESSDGTSFEARTARTYRGVAIGENIAASYPTPRDAVVGWLCSTGHRENLLSDDFHELGTGAADLYWTQDFGSRGEKGPPLRMGAHLRTRGGGLRLLLDVATTSPPERVQAIVEGEAWDMAVLAGRPVRGVWAVDLDATGGCRRYWFEADIDGVRERFPADGAYGVGDCAWDDVRAQWLRARSIEALEAAVERGDDDDDDTGRGCSTVPGAAGWVVAGIVLGVRRRRRG